MERGKKQMNQEKQYCVLFLRVSTEKQEKEGLSLEAQEDYLRDYAARENFEVLKVFEAGESGKPAIRKKVERAVIIRVKKEYKRKNGVRIKFEDNAAVLVDKQGLPKASEVKGCIAKEVGERFPKIAGIASVVI